jgi:glycosyltransferase involved in cell wall biosynthesis
MRIGQNPAKSLDTNPQPQKITAVLVNYIPFLSGYFAQSLDVLRLCLDSMRENADLPFDLIVFDNASCHEVRQFLTQEQEDGAIQYLILSEQNMGKGGAWNFLFSAAPGEIVAYCDNDIYFYPGWLSALLKPLESIPGAGMITGMPLLNPEEYSTSTVAWAQALPGAVMERGRLLPWPDYWMHAGSLGNDEATAHAFYNAHESLRLTYQAEQYYIGAGHFQFLARKEILMRTLPLPTERPMGQVRKLDVAINDLGYLRLCTSQIWVRHMGNSLKGEDFHTGRTVPPSRRLPKPSLWRKFLTWLNEFTFRVLNS